MVAESGARLLEADAHQALVTEILPRATVLTPNLPEAHVLIGGDGELDDEQLIRDLLALGPQIVVLTGGHRTQATDLFLDRTAEGRTWSPGPRHLDGAAHGSGCTHSSVLAARLALGDRRCKQPPSRALSPARP